MPGKLVIKRWPQDDDELHAFVAAVWGFHIPRRRICPGHKAPFEAFADAYFARSPVSIWKGSRGFAGKSTLLGMLTITEAVTLGAQVTVLGGSAAQSQRVHEVTHEAWYAPYAPVNLLATDPTTFKTRLKNGAWIIALLASQKSVRGPHPQRLRLDEIDEMDYEILEGAQGQPMDKGNVLSQTVMSSTHQYPDKTMTAMLKRAAEKDWPVFEWCWRESLTTNGGWLTPEQVERKRAEVSDHMWSVEYDLQEPSIDGRAINTDAVMRAFDPSLGEYAGGADDYLIFELPEDDGEYVTAADWAKEQDWTVIRTYRTDVRPWREVAFLKTGRKPWPEMVADFDARLALYGGVAVHDATGIGNVIDDLLEHTGKVKGIVLRGRDREIVFNEYIKAIETDEVVSPRITYAYDEHRYVTLKDLYGSGHPPDSFIAGALAWSTRNKKMIAVRPGSVSRGESPWSTR